MIERAAKPVLLLVDDTATDIRILNEVLKTDYKVFFATNWKDCLEIAHSKQPDLILLDVMMPEVDGYEVCRRLKIDSQTADIPVIFVTALSDESDETRGFELGAVDYITKPFKPAVVRARVKTQLLIRSQQAELIRKQHKIEEGLRAAGYIQQCLLPSVAIEQKRVDIAWKFTPCEAVGGDIFNVVRLDASHIGLYMVDVAGHGPPSAMLSVLVYQLMNPGTGILIDDSRSPPVLRQPEEVLNILDIEFPLMRFQRHFTIIYGVLNLHTGELTYSNAAHCTPVIQRVNGELELLEEAGTIIGLQVIPFGQGKAILKKGDCVLFYSDGVIELENPKAEGFGTARLNQELMKCVGASSRDVVDTLYNAALGFAQGQPLADDVSLLAFRYLGESESRGHKAKAKSKPEAVSA